jgi:hypothetical protein
VRTSVCAIGIAVGFGCFGCTIIPDMPPDLALPVRDIFLHSACELKAAFTAINSDPKLVRFNAKGWVVKIAIIPTVDTNLEPGVGFTRQVPTLSTAPRNTKWSIGGTPGMQLQGTGERSGQVNYDFNSSDLITDNVLPCDEVPPSLHMLAQHMGVREWLTRTASVLNDTKSAKFDSPTYNADLTVEFNAGTNTYTYTFPQATDLFSFVGYYKIDEKLQISLTAATTSKKLTIVTLPVGDNFESNAAQHQVQTTTTIESAQSRLDIIGLQQAINSLSSRISPSP